jgi:hypothetical protein
MKSDNTLFYIILTATMITLVIAACTLGYQWGIKACEEDTKSPYEPEKVETYIYDLKPGRNGILRFSVDEDSLAYVVYVEKGDTFALDGMIRSEFDSLAAVLYPELTAE